MIEPLKIFYVFSISFLASFLFTPLTRRIALKAGVVDRPGKRKVHARPVPYLGGVAIYLAFTTSILVALHLSEAFKIELSGQFIGLMLGGMVIVALGLWDDVKSIHPLTKIAGQIVASLIIFGYGFRIEMMTNPFGGVIHFPLPLSILITIIWIIGLINAVNLIDGLDGLAAGLTSIAGTILFFVAVSTHNVVTAFLLAAIVGSALGFLRYNFYPAKIFMGDTGSMFIGFILAVSAIVGLQFQHKMATVVALLIPITALVIPVSDTLMAIVRRMIGKTPVFMADKRHLHHRLLDMGLTQRQVIFLLYLIGLYFGIIAYLFTVIPAEYAFTLMILLGLGVFFGIRTLGFIERRLRIIHRRGKN